MIFSHLVDPPRAVEGGVLFTMDVHDLQRTVCVTSDALALLAPAAATDRARVHYVMTRISGITELAKEKASTRLMPELLVIGLEDVPRLT